MIPAFPVFKGIMPEDRTAIEAHTAKFAPYSDFNFTSLWAWDTKRERQVSLLNDNLVARFTDYDTHEPFLSFLGDRETERTARALIDHSLAQGMPGTLRLVPEVSTVGIRPSVLKVEEDRDNFDYVYSIAQHATFLGGDFKRSRNFVNTFKKLYPEARVEIADLSSPEVQHSLMAVLNAWKANKQEAIPGYDLSNEEEAIRRLFETARSHPLLVTAVFVEDEVRAFSIDEQLPSSYAIAHFRKADIRYKGIYDFLIQEKAKHLQTLGVELVNFEQDLGVASLRASKLSYRPVSFLKKFSVSLTQ